MHVWKPSGSLAEEMQDTNCVGERHLFHYFSLVMRRCDVVFEAIATNWLKWLQRAGGWPRSSRPSPRARPTFSLSGLGHTSCQAATSPSPNLHPPLSLSPSFFGTASAAEPARIPWPQFQSQGHPSSTSGARQAICDKFLLPQLLFETYFAAV